MLIKAVPTISIMDICRGDNEQVSFISTIASIITACTRYTVKEYSSKSRINLSIGWLYKNFC